MLEIDEARRSLVQDKLIDKAYRLRLPVPIKQMKQIENEHEDENWFYGHFGEVLLKDHALTNLRREIRRETKESRELWIPIIFALTGLIGAAAALSSIWLSWFSKPN